ncbi:unnamed protein product, partial [Discosporangium mesarthrocarpum]
ELLDSTALVGGASGAYHQHSGPAPCFTARRSGVRCPNAPCPGAGRTLAWGQGGQEHGASCAATPAWMQVCKPLVPQTTAGPLSALLALECRPCLETLETEKRRWEGADPILLSLSFHLLPALGKQESGDSTSWSRAG